MKIRWGQIELSDEELRKHYDRYREFSLRGETVDMIQELLDKGWIEVIDDPSHDKE